jgi:methylenetetrahydrofolate reductase (NADPH)
VKPSLPPAAHLTCVGSDKASVDAVAREFQAVGVNHFVALRGDPPEGVGAAYEPHPEGYANGAELVAGLRAIDDFEISVSAYPERHPESPDFATDIDMLKRKVDAGATRAITQFFFDNDIYERYVERVRRAGIYIPIVPGILPIHNFGQVARFSSSAAHRCPIGWRGALTDWRRIRKPELWLRQQLQPIRFPDLVERGVDDFHFYTMNRAQLVYAICHLLGLRSGETAAVGAAA